MERVIWLNYLIWSEEYWWLQQRRNHCTWRSKCPSDCPIFVFNKAISCCLANMRLCTTNFICFNFWSTLVALPHCWPAVYDGICEWLARQQLAMVSSSSLPHCAGFANRLVAWVGVASPRANQSGAQSLQQRRWLVWSAGGAGRVYSFLGTESYCCVVENHKEKRWESMSKTIKNMIWQLFTSCFIVVSCMTDMGWLLDTFHL